MSRTIRALAVCGALFLMGATALAPRLRADAARDAQPLWASYPTCTWPIVNTGWDTVVTVPPYGGMAQPIPFTSNIAACSLKVSPSYTFGRLDVVQWDANAVAPDPTSVALRSVSLNSSNMAWNWLHVPMSPPLVTRALANLADPPKGEGAMVYTGTYAYNTTGFRYLRDGDAAMPTGFFQTGAGWQPLAGPHAVHGVSVCGGDGLLQELRVVQSVMHTDAMLARTHYEALQRFRVPRPVRVHWVEVALDSASFEYYSIGAIALHRDGIGETPPPEMPPALVSASLWPQSPLPAWVSHFDFDSSLTLLPGTDYWLRVTPAHYYALRTHAITGSEGPAFTSAIGPLWKRFENGYHWLPVTGQALSFRVIGDTLVSLVDAGPAPTRASFALSASPNPARGLATLAWSGARGGVRLEVLDARGRRVGGFDRRAGGSGEWNWLATAAGRPLPPGLYFVRAHDDAGRTALARVALIR